MVELFLFRSGNLIRISTPLPVEAQNVALRRNSAFSCRTNTYAKCGKGLQRSLDVHQITHNFVRFYRTTGEVAAVALEIIKGALCLEDVLTSRFS